MTNLWKTTCRALPALLIAALLVVSASIPCARAALTIEEEQKLGREIYEKLEKANALSKNQKVNDYIRRIGEQILAHQQRVPWDFKFHVINSSAINAFATPGATSTSSGASSRWRKTRANWPASWPTKSRTPMPATSTR